MKNPIFRSEFWHQYWIAIRRSKRDSRDRKNVLQITFFLLAFVCYYGYLILYASRGFLDREMIFPTCIGACFALMIVIGIAINNRLDARKARSESDLAVDQFLRQRLASDGFALSVLLMRSGSEELLREKQLPTEVEIITRRAHLAQLHKLEMWDQLPSELKNLLLLPDGHWQRDSLHRSAAFETLRCLRWVLRLDGQLQPLTYLPKMDYRPAAELLITPERLLTSTGMVEIWDIRVERNHADTFFSRCYAEAIGRNLIQPDVEDIHAWATDVFENARSSDQRDILVQHEAISELNEETFRYVFGLSFQRYSCLQIIMNLIDGLDQWQAWNNLCFPIKKTPAETVTP
jgi:hypothetical protein